MSRKEKIREGLEIDFDLLDSDVLRFFSCDEIAWFDSREPFLVWSESADPPRWKPGDDSCQVQTRELTNERAIRQGRRAVRLYHYKSYGCLAELARRPIEPGSFVIRMPPDSGYPVYVQAVDEARMPRWPVDPDSSDFKDIDCGFEQTSEVAEAKRFTHAEAIRLTIRIMAALGYDIPGDGGDYWEPVRDDVAEELHARAVRRPRRAKHLRAVMNDLSREP